jgi:geranyl-CoA carboxylase alpha subunit
MKYRSLLVANRGEIALRVMRTAKRMGLRTIAVYSDADRDAPHVRAADAAVHVGGSSPKDSYLSIKAVLQAEGEAVHPGYGFLSENPDFAEAVQKAGRTWIGPPPAAIRAMGDKANAKALAAKAGVPVLPTYDRNPEFPLMIKALAGGGGRGMRLVKSKGELDTALKSAQSEAEHAFGDGRVLMEKALLQPRHVEVQVFADSQGNCIHLGERDCSVQRRHQKLIEESPSPAVDAKLRKAMGEAAVAAAKAVGYIGAGTVEFLLEDGKFWFMEMNTRLQVEHPVTELVTGLDLVEWQLRIAAGEPLPLQQNDVRFTGHAIEARLCAEDPTQDFLPQAGRIALWQSADGVRTDHALETGATIPPFYDSMVAKVIAHGATRDEARERLAQALCETVLLGLPTNKDFLAAVLRDGAFARGEATTDFLASFKGPVADMAEAGLAAAALSVAQSGHGEWTAWSNNPARELRFRFGGKDLALRADALAKAAKPLASAVEGDTVHLALPGGSFSLENTLHAPAARRGGAAGSGILAPMNGRVVGVHAKAGDSAEAGQVLVVLEAMKMEHQLTAPAKVKVKAVHVAAGAQVAPGKLLVEFEAAA